MFFCNNLEKDLESLQSYHSLEDEMSKYKTLHHENIQWDKVYEYSQDILKSHSIDAKFCNYFVLACLNLNNEECFNQLTFLFGHLKDFLEKTPENLQIKPNALKTQKNKLKSTIEHFIDEVNRTKLKVSSDVLNELNELFSHLEKLLECQFNKFQTKVVAPSVKSPVTQVDINIKSTNINSLDDREYRNFCQKLAFELLESNINNLNAYSMFVESMWGRIKSLPGHSDNVTRLRYPDRDLIRILLENKESELEHMKCFMSNLALNPFWIEGTKLFCEFLEKHKKMTALKILVTLTGDFIHRFEDISKLCFENGEPFCREEVFNYFVKQDGKDKNVFRFKKKEKEKSFEQVLVEIDNENYNNSLFCNVNALIDLAKVFEEKNMRKNAKILYCQLAEIMEKTLLKDYLTEEYANAKNKIK